MGVQLLDRSDRCNRSVISIIAASGGWRLEAGGWTRRGNIELALLTLDRRAQLASHSDELAGWQASEQGGGRSQFCSNKRAASPIR